MFAKRLGQGNDTFLSENECFKRFRVHPKREKAKWQNRVIPFSNSGVARSIPVICDEFPVLSVLCLFVGAFGCALGRGISNVPATAQMLKRAKNHVDSLVQSFAQIVGKEAQDEKAVQLK